MAKIIICHSDGNEDKYGLSGGKFSIGRADTNDIVLPDGSSSNQHAALELQENEEYAVSDLGSTNHTKVNGRIIFESTPLRHEDRILFGDTLAIYHATDPEAEPAEEIAPPPAPKKKKRKKEKKSATAPIPEPIVPNQPTPTPVPGSGCLGIVLAAAIPAIGYLILR